MLRIVLKYWLLLLNTLLLTVTNSAASPIDTIRVRFEFNEYRLSDKAQLYLDSAWYRGDLAIQKSIRIIGYSDYVGGEGYNSILSKKRANSVFQYLIASGLPKDKVILCIGKGKIRRSVRDYTLGYAGDRRVDIIINSGSANKLLVAPQIKVDSSIQLSTAIKPFSSIMSLNDVKVNESIVLDSVTYAAGSHVIPDSSIGILQRLYKMLKKQKRVNIRIEGHICCEMPIASKYPDALDRDTKEHSLSVNRARYIYEYLIAQGITPSRLSYIGFATTRPLIKGKSWDSRNRRVEIRIISK